MSEQGTAPGTPAAQPAAPAPAGVNGGAPEAAGQGQAAGDPSLYEKYVANTPEELRPFVIDALRQHDADVTPRFQEAAEIRKAFEPYQAIDGFDELTPDDVGEFIAFRREVLSDPDAMAVWMGQMAEEHGILPTLSEEAWVSLGTEQGWLDEGEGGEAGQQQAPAESGQLESILSSFRDEILGQIAPVQEHLARQQEQQAQAELRDGFAQRLQALEGQHGELDEDGRSHVIRLAQGYLGTQDPIGAAFEEHLRITGRAVGDATDGKLAQRTAPALPGGTPDTSPPSYGHDDPRLRQAALARLRA